MNSNGKADSCSPVAEARPFALRTTHWTLHPAGPDLLPDGTHPNQPDPQHLDVHGWLELCEDELTGSRLRLAGLLRGSIERDDGLDRCHFRFQGEVVRLDEGVMIADGQLGMGARLEPSSARLCLRRFRLRDGAELLDIRFHLTSDDALPDGLEVDLTAVRIRSAG